jgi:hypothetical protein
LLLDSFPDEAVSRKLFLKPDGTLELQVMGQLLQGEEPFEVAYYEVGILGGLEELGLPGDGLYGCLGGKINWQVGVLPELDLKIVGLHGFLKPVEHLSVHLAQIFHRVVVQK